MTESKLKRALQSIVQEYGVGMVLKSLGEIADSRCENVERVEPSHHGTVNVNRRKVPKVTAPDYVKRMELPVEKIVAVAELAERFQHKSFLPTFGDVTNFCQLHEIEVPASRSRVSAIPRVFKFIAEMEVEEIQRILDDGMFSGPSRLGPIAAAIRNYGSAASRQHSG